MSNERSLNDVIETIRKAEKFIVIAVTDSGKTLDVDHFGWASPYEYRGVLEYTKDTKFLTGLTQTNSECLTDEDIYECMLGSDGTKFSFAREIEKMVIAKAKGENE